MRKRVFCPIFVLAVMMLASTFAVAQASRPSVKSAEVNGTFWMKYKGKFKDSASEIKISALGGGKLHVSMSLLYPYATPQGELSANMGELDGEALIEGDTAVYESSEPEKCKITIKFVKLGTIKVRQDGADFSCGFGHRVTADGTYTRISAKKPKFD